MDFCVFKNRLWHLNAFDIARLAFIDFTFYFKRLIPNFVYHKKYYVYIYI